MDALAIILRHIRLSIEATGVPPDSLQQCLEQAELTLRRNLGGQSHHITRTLPMPAKARILQLSEHGLDAKAIAERTDTHPQYVRRILRWARSSAQPANQSPP